MSSRHRDGAPLPDALIEAWHDQAADAREVQRAYLRFLRRRRPGRARAPALQIARWVVVGAVIGIGTVYAATVSLQLLGGSAEVMVVQRASPPVAASSSQRASLPLPSSQRVEYPAITPQPPLPSSAVAPPTPVASTVASSEQWQRAARGLRERDFETANAALEELARQGSNAERESAQLVRAQLLLAQGRENDAVTLLRTLHNGARSATVRQKSAELLARVNESRPSQRSFAPAEGTNDP